jgi:hypothetical protein
VGAVVGYLRVHHGQRFASTAAVTPMTEAFVRNIEEFVNAEGVDLVTFEKGQRSDDITQKYLRSFGKSEGVVYVGKAQEKARLMRTERRLQPPHRRNLSVDRGIHRHGQSLLLRASTRTLVPSF